MKLADQLINKIPLPKYTRLSWNKRRTDDLYKLEILLARKAQDYKKVEALQYDRHFEIAVIEEEENQLLSERLINKAKRLRVPVPRRLNDDGSPSSLWSEGIHLGGWYLSSEGFSLLREEIRKEQLARHENRAIWVRWVPHLIGLIGSLTGLIAVFMHK